MTIRKYLRHRKPVMRNFILTHDPVFPKPGKRVLFVCEFAGGHFEQDVGVYYPNPARIVKFGRISSYGIPSPGETIPWKYIQSWFPYRGEGVKRKKTRKVTL